MGIKLLGFSTGRGFGAPKGLSDEIQKKNVRTSIPQHVSRAVVLTIYLRDGPSGGWIAAFAEAVNSLVLARNQTAVSRSEKGQKNASRGRCRASGPFLVLLGSGLAVGLGVG